MKIGPPREDVEHQRVLLPVVTEHQAAVEVPPDRECEEEEDEGGEKGARAHERQGLGRW